MWSRLRAVVGLTAAMGTVASADEAPRTILSLRAEVAHPMLRVGPRLWAVLRVAVEPGQVTVGDEVCVRLRCAKGACEPERAAPCALLEGGTPMLRGRVQRFLEDAKGSVVEDWAVVVPAPFPIRVSPAQDRAHAYQGSLTHLLTLRYEVTRDGSLEFLESVDAGTVRQLPVTWK